MNTPRVVLVTGVARHLGAQVAGRLAADPRVERVADAALEQWTDVAPSTQLRKVLPAALRLGRLGRCESWVRCFASMDESELAEYGDAAAYFLAATAEEGL